MVGAPVAAVLEAPPCCDDAWARAVSVRSVEGGPSPTLLVAMTRTAYPVSSDRLMMVYEVPVVVAEETSASVCQLPVASFHWIRREFSGEPGA